VVAARDRNPGGTTGAGRGATRGSKPGGISGTGRRGVGVEVPAVVRLIPMVETVGPDSQRKSRSVRLGETASEKLSSSKTTYRETISRFVERSKAAIAFVVGRVAQEDTGWSVRKAYVARWQSC
jgi:L-aminopeptidase/D-esterase-like protein